MSKPPKSITPDFKQKKEKYLYDMLIVAIRNDCRFNKEVINLGKTTTTDYYEVYRAHEYTPLVELLIKNKEVDHDLEALIKIANVHKCTTAAQIIALSNISHSKYYTSNYHRNSVLNEIIKKNKKVKEADQLPRLLDLIQEHEIYTGVELAALAGLQYETFSQNYLPLVKDALNEMKVALSLQNKRKIRNSDHPTCLVAYQKLVGTEDERRYLTGKNVDVTSGGKPVNMAPIIVHMDEEE